MILKIISKYGLAAHLGLLASFPVAFAPFLSQESLACVILWLSLFAAIWIFFDPSIRIGERSAEARARVLASVIRDPIFYFFILAVGFALVRWINSGIALWYDAEQSKWLVKEAAAPVLPASAGNSGFLPMAVSIGLGVFVVGVRNALGLLARVFCGMTAVTIVGVGGLVVSTCVCLNVCPELVQYVKSNFAQVPFIGLPYGFFLLMSIVFGMDAESRKWPYARLPYVIAVAGSASALFFFAPPLAVVAHLLVVILFFVFASVYSARVGSMGGFARSMVFTLLGLAVPALLVMAVASPELQQMKLDGLNPELAFPVEYSSLTETLARISKSMWLERPWCGVGVGAFGVNLPFFAVKADWTVLPPHVSNAVSGFWTLLAERGIAGCALLSVGLGLMIWAWCARLVEAFLFLHGNDEADIFLFACPPVVWIAPFVIILGVAEMFFSHSFASAASVFAFTVPLALSAASFPRDPRRPAPEQNADASLEKEGK